MLPDYRVPSPLRFTLHLRSSAIVCAQGEFSEPVLPDDSMWNLADDTVEVTLTKAEGMHWWGAVVKGDPAIDTQKVRGRVGVGPGMRDGGGQRGRGRRAVCGRARA